MTLGQQPGLAELLRARVLYSNVTASAEDEFISIQFLSSLVKDSLRAGSPVGEQGSRWGTFELEVIMVCLHREFQASQIYTVRPYVNKTKTKEGWAHGEAEEASHIQPVWAIYI